MAAEFSGSARNVVIQTRARFLVRFLASRGQVEGKLFVMKMSTSDLEKPGNIAARPPLAGLLLMTNSLETGGTERQFATLAKALDRAMFSVSLASLKREGPFLQELGHVNEFSPGGSLLKWRSLRSRLALARFLRKKRIAVAHSFDFYSNLMLIPAARLARVPVVIASHRQIGDLLSPMKFRAQSAMFRLCDRVVCNSHAAAERLLRAGLPQSRLTVIPNAVGDEFFAPEPPALPRDGQTFTVGMIARMNDSSKRHDIFLRAAARLASRFPELRFILVGDGPLRTGLEQLAQSLGLGDRAIFLGERSDMPAVLASLDVGVLPSSSESCSNVILESMAAGVPVITTSVGGNRELIEQGETGLLVGCGDEAQLAKAIQTFLTQPELRRQCATQARQNVQANYNTRKVTDSYQDLYCDLLEQKQWNPARV
jgi:glycosyltransferase involved in cell wall biosynthesis